MEQMDPGLHEEIAEGPEDELVDVVVRLRQSGEVPEGLEVVARFDDVVTGRVLRRDLLRVHDEEDVESLKAAETLYPSDSINDSDTEDVTPAPTDARVPASDPARGRGVVVAVLDWWFRPGPSRVPASRRPPGRWLPRARAVGPARRRWHRTPARALRLRAGAQAR
jgi:hypothetical protein